MLDQSLSIGAIEMDEAERVVEEGYYAIRLGHDGSRVVG
jgi:hypothetical protein